VTVPFNFTAVYRGAFFGCGESPHVSQRGSFSKKIETQGLGAYIHSQKD
jgi:hypothetical protein